MSDAVMKPPVPEVKVTLDKERTLRLDLFAFREFKRITRELGLGPDGKWGKPEGISLLKYVGDLDEILDEETLPVLITAALLHEDGTLDVDQVSRLLTTENLEELAHALIGLLEEFLADEEDGESKGDSPDEGPPSKSSGQSEGTT